MEILSSPSINTMNTNEILKLFHSNTNEKSKAGMKRFGINTDKAFGLSIPFLRNLGKQIGKDHELALELWESDYHEARILATMIDESSEVTEYQMDNWANDFNSWDLCDQACNNLFVFTDFADSKAIEWAHREEEFVRRAGFVLMAVSAVHRKEMKDEDFQTYFDLIKEFSLDERNFVKKGVNWALRQIGKRNTNLNNQAVKVCEELLSSESTTVKWIAKNAMKELRDPKHLSRIKKKERA